MGTQTENVDIVVSESGSVKAADALASMSTRAGEAADKVETLGKQTEHTHSIMDQFSGILAKVGLALGVKEVVEYADSYSLLISRLSQVTTSAENLIETEKKLFELSEHSRTSFEANANFFLKAAVNADHLGVSQKQLLEVTELLNKSFIASGATEGQAANGLAQLTRAFTTGNVNGRQLLTILKDFPVAAKALADGLGVPVSSLQALAAKGGITAKSLTEAFVKSADEINKAFKAVAPTVSSALGLLKDAFTRQIGILDQANGGSRRLAEAILFLADHIDTIIRVVGFATAAFLAFRAGLLIQSGLTAFSTGLAFVQAGLAAYVVRMEAAGVATTVMGRLTETLRLSFSRLNATMAANPIASVITAGVILAGVMQTLGPKIRLANDEFDRQRSLLGVVLGVVRTVVRSVQDAIGAYEEWRKGLGSFGDVLAALFGKYQKLSDNIAQATKDTDANGLSADNLTKTYGGNGNDGLSGAIDKTSASLKQMNKFLEETGVQMGRVDANLIPVFTNLVKAEEVVKQAAEAWKKYSEEVDKNAAKVAANALTTRNAMGDIITSTSEMAAQAGDSYNRVAQAANNAAAAINTVTAAQQAAKESTSGSTFVDTAQNINKFAKAAGGTSATEQIIAQIEQLGSFNGGGGAVAMSKLISIYHMLQGEPANAAKTIVDSYPFLRTAFASANLPGFATGGAFTVGGSGGSDTSLVQFMGTPGEHVEITTPAQRAAGKGSPGGRAVHVTMVVNTPDANSFRRSQPQLIKSLKSKLAAN